LILFPACLELKESSSAW